MSKIDMIREALREQAYGAILITSPIGRLFATGFSSTAGSLIITETDALFLIDSRYFEAAGKAIPDAVVRLSSKESPYHAQAKAALDALGIGAVGFEDGSVSYADYLFWEDKLERKLVPASKLLNSLRAVKSRDDLAGMIRAQRLAECSFDEILPLIGTGITEKQLAAELIYRCLRNGADDLSFDPIVVSGPRSSMPHGVPGHGVISRGFLTIDFGVKLDGWCSDTTRTLCVGPPDGEMAAIYEIVLEAQLAGIASVRAGVCGKDVDAAARSVIEKAGYGDRFGHGFGHEIGLEVHETLKAAPSSEDTLPAGAMISAEPGIYLPGRFGVRIEDTLFITEDGSENITKLPKSLTVI